MSRQQRAGRPHSIHTFLDFEVKTCLHMALSILALHDMLSRFSGHMGEYTLISVQHYEAESVVLGLMGLVGSLDISPYFDAEVPQYQVLLRSLKPFDEPPAPKTYEAWHVAGESVQTLIWRALDGRYDKTTLVKMLNTVFAVLTFADRRLRLESRPTVRMTDEGYPQIEDGVAVLVTFNVPKRMLI